jgi:ATP-dependent helicase/nuclease subunit A
MDILAKNLLILASAGSGKTFQLGNRVIGLVVKGVGPERIVALTFTRKAAGEFADSVLTKLAEAAGDEAKADAFARGPRNRRGGFQGGLGKGGPRPAEFHAGHDGQLFRQIVRGLSNMNWG